MSFEEMVQAQAGPLARRLRRMLGDPHAAEDLCQEALARAWSSAPRDLPDEHLRAWLHRTATNLGLDELRRRRVRRATPLDDALDAGLAPDPDAALHAREALGRLTPHERMLLLLRFQAGLSHREIGELLDVQESTGADVTVLDPESAGLTLAGADAFVLSGSGLDVHPRLYGEEPSPRATPGDLERDRRDLGLVRQALADDVPIVGVCRGAQLINIALGGSLWQDLETSSVAHGSDDSHPVRTGEGSPLRRIVGREPAVGGAHHQAVRRLGRGVRPTAVSADGVVEAIDVPSRRFALGLQWHPESPASPVAGPLVAEALVRAAAAAA